MCDYVKKGELIEPRKNLIKWINKVQKDIKKNHKITFSYEPMGSAKRKMVVRKCNEDYFDFDYRLIIQKVPDDLIDNCKELKDIFRYSFNNNKPSGFCDCKDRSQSLRTKNVDDGYGLDITIFRKESDNFYILFNNKDSNDANNKDYEWQIRSEMNKFRERYKKIKGSVMWTFLRGRYLEKRHNHKDDNYPSKKASYQLFNDAVVETLQHFGISIN